MHTQVIDTTPQDIPQTLDEAVVSDAATRWKGLQVRVQQGLEGAGRFYQELVTKLGKAVGIADGEPVWNQYQGCWQVAVNFATGCKSVACDWLVAV
ncbi:MAG: hypothetical protein KME40_30240 [Komarekiella atlantica HA4396-MV6]|jgi:hypothetical protein|nr:hypothetical protein [Komarekiella atlantica HA4396-MV6]